jgi:hypothetical protein
MQNRVQTGWSVFEHVYRKVFNVCRNWYGINIAVIMDWVVNALWHQ